ncbi:MAG: hypothetical protein FE78DRAFT_85157 [Acidomyces sp. 'richmondensis']|nr:MAG: hypothetical protein FE78DRAFT_85157 [Acidomyces sp. 'richmondensis']
MLIHLALGLSYLFLQTTRAGKSTSSGDALITVSSIASSLTALPTQSRATYPTDYSPSSLASTSTSTSHSNISNSTTHNATISTSSSSSTKVIETDYSGTRTTSTSAASDTVYASCNGYPELCNRKYSNVTYVMAHNSPFVVPNNAASNQMLGVKTQLNDGIRGLQFETHKPNASSPMMLCHTSCDLLNVGPLEDYLVTVREWLDENRYEVITIMVGNEDFVDASNYIAPFENSGMIDYLYVPKSAPMGLDGWPTLGEMILTNKRVVVMLAYDANQTAIPWLLEQWNYAWQTPFSPTNPEFPCTVQRPPNQSKNISYDRLYTANHNLNLQIEDKALGVDILVPYWPKLHNTNANYTTIEGCAGTTVDHCTNMWGRPPNYLLVDYYNIGNFNGSTLAAGARANNVTYYPGSCCGLSKPYVAAAASLRSSMSLHARAVAVAVVLMLAIW